MLHFSGNWGLSILRPFKNAFSEKSVHLVVTPHVGHEAPYLRYDLEAGGSMGREAGGARRSQKQGMLMKEKISGVNP